MANVYTDEEAWGTSAACKERSAGPSSALNEAHASRVADRYVPDPVGEGADRSGIDVTRPYRSG